MATSIKICPRCYETTGDTFECDSATPPADLICDDCGSRLQPRGPIESDGPEGWLGDRDYSEPYDPEAECDPYADQRMDASDFEEPAHA